MYISIYICICIYIYIYICLYIYICIWAGIIYPEGFYDGSIILITESFVTKENFAQRAFSWLKPFKWELWVMVILFCYMHLWICMHACMHAHIFVCTHIHTYIHRTNFVGSGYLSQCVHVCVCMYMRTYSSRLPCTCRRGGLAA